MKNTLKGVLFLVLALIILTAVFFGAYACYLLSGFSLLSVELGGDDFWALLFSGLALLFPLILSLALFAAFLLRLRLHPGIRPLTSLLLWLVSLGFLWGAGFLYQGRGPEDVVSQADYYFIPGMIYNFPAEQEAASLASRGVPAGASTGGIYIGESQGTELFRVILPEAEERPPAPVSRGGAAPVVLIPPEAYHLEYYPTGTQEGQDLLLQRRGGGTTTVSLLDTQKREEDPARRSLPDDKLTIPSLPINRESSSELFIDFSRLGLGLLDLKSRGDPLEAASPSRPLTAAGQSEGKGRALVYLLSLAAVSLYAVSAWGFIRVSRWPFFNALVVFFLLTGASAFYGLLSDPIMVPVVRMTAGIRQSLPLWAAILGVLGLLLLIIDILFIPYKKRIEEESDE
jgi:hypothetical protein